jgi:RNA polymerase sigma-70 factor, ECF subfamily
MLCKNILPSAIVKSVYIYTDSNGSVRIPKHMSRPTDRHEPTFADLTSWSDDALMNHLKTRNGDALAILFKRYQRLVFNVAMKILRDLGEAEDLTQSLFMQLYKTADAFEPSIGSAKAWIVKHAYNLSQNRRRHLAVRQFYTSEQVTEMYEFVPLLECRQMNHPERKLIIQESLSTLNDTQRLVLQMAFFEGFTLKEIAERTGDSDGNVRHHYYRGIDKLRAHLTEPCKEGVQFVRKEAISEA